LAEDQLGVQGALDLVPGHANPHDAISVGAQLDWHRRVGRKDEQENRDDTKVARDRDYPPKFVDGA
jgi:hypothetical protein